MARESSVRPLGAVGRLRRDELARKAAWGRGSPRSHSGDLGQPPHAAHERPPKTTSSKNQILNVTTGLPFGCTGAKSSNASSCVNALPRRRTAAPPRQEEARTSARTAGQWISARGARLKGLRTPFVCSLKPPKKGYDAPPPKTNSEGSFVVPRASRTDSPAPIIGPRRYSASSTRGWIPA